MPDQSTFEARLARLLEADARTGLRVVDHRAIARSLIAGPSRRRLTRSLDGGVWRVLDLRPRRAILALAATTLIVLGALLAGAALILRSPATEAWRAVMSRLDGRALTILLVNADGRQHTLRRLAPEGLGIDPGYMLDPFVSVSPRGWVEVSTGSSPTDPCDVHECPDDGGAAMPSYGLEILVDLADPARAPIALPANGFMRGRWGPDGRYALYCGSDCGADPGVARGVRVLDPDVGTDSGVIVPNVQTFGPNPEIIWAADGSGFLERLGSEWAVKLIAGGQPGRVVSGVLRIQSRWFQPAAAGEADPIADPTYDTRFTGRPWYAGELSPATSVAAQVSADGTAVWQLLQDDDPERAMLAQLIGPGDVGSVRTFELPSGPAVWFSLSADDSLVAIAVDDSEHPRWTLGALGDAGQIVTTGPAIEGGLAGFVQAGLADAWAVP
jgi:hypothetical protein